MLGAVEEGSAEQGDSFHTPPPPSPRRAGESAQCETSESRDAAQYVARQVVRSLDVVPGRSDDPCAMQQLLCGSIGLAAAELSDDVHVQQRGAREQGSRENRWASAALERPNRTLWAVTHHVVIASPAHHCLHPRSAVVLQNRSSPFCGHQHDARSIQPTPPPAQLHTDLLPTMPHLPPPLLIPLLLPRLHLPSQTTPPPLRPHPHPPPTPRSLRAQANPFPPPHLLLPPTAPAPHLPPPTSHTLLLPPSAPHPQPHAQRRSHLLHPRPLHPPPPPHPSPLSISTASPPPCLSPCSSPTPPPLPPPPSLHASSAQRAPRLLAPALPHSAHPHLPLLLPSPLPPPSLPHHLIPPLPSPSPLPSSSPILSSHHRSMSHHLLHSSTLHSLYHQPPPLTSSPHPHPPLTLHPTSLRVLDAPHLLDDYYLSLLDWSPANLIAIALSSSLYLYDPSTSAITNLLTLCPPTPITSTRFGGSEGQVVAVGCDDGATLLMDVRTGQRLRGWRAHDARVGSLSWRGGGGGGSGGVGAGGGRVGLLTSGSRDGRLVHVDVRAKGVVGVWEGAHEEEVCGLEWSPMAAGCVGSQ